VRAETLTTGHITPTAAKATSQQKEKRHRPEESSTTEGAEGNKHKEASRFSSSSFELPWTHRPSTSAAASTSFVEQVSHVLEPAPATDSSSVDAKDMVHTLSPFRSGKQVSTSTSRADSAATPGKAKGGPGYISDDVFVSPPALQHIITPDQDHQDREQDRPSKLPSVGVGGAMQEPQRQQQPPTKRSKNRARVDASPWDSSQSRDHLTTADAAATAGNKRKWHPRGAAAGFGPDEQGKAEFLAGGSLVMRGEPDEQESRTQTTTIGGHPSTLMRRESRFPPAATAAKAKDGSAVGPVASSILDGDHLLVKFSFSPLLPISATRSALLVFCALLLFLCGWTLKEAIFSTGCGRFRDWASGFFGRRKNIAAAEVLLQEE